MPKELKVVIVGDASQLNKTFSQASTGAKTFGDRMNNVGASMRSVGKHMAVAGGIITGVSVVVGKKLVDSALAAESAQAKLDRAFQNSGLSAQRYSRQVEQVEKSGRQLGFTNIETLNSFTKLIQSGESVTQATRDMGLAQDYARSTGRDLETATGALVKVHQGLLRPLKELGISLPQNTDHMKALTAAHKASKTEITANEKALAFQQDKLATGAQAIQLMTDKLHGQADAFSQTSAGGMAAFQAKLDALEENLGKFLLPFLDKAVGYLNRVADAFANLSPHTQKLIVDIGLAVAAFGAVLLVVGPIVAAIGSLISVIVALASPIGLIVVGLAALVAALVAAVLWPDKLQAALQRMGLSAKDSKEIVDDLRNAFTAIKTVVQTVWPVIQSVVVPALRIIQGILMIVSGILRGDFSEAWKGMKIVVVNEMKFVLATILAMPRIVLGAAIAIGKAILDGIGRGLTQLGALIRENLGKIPGWIAAAASAAVTAAYRVGQNIVHGLVSGMISVASSAISSAASYIASLIPGFMKRFLGIKSPSTVMAEEVGGPIMEGVAAGITEAASSAAKAAYDAAKKVLDAAKQAVEDSKGIFSSAFDELSSTALAAFDKISSDFETKTEKKIRKQDEARAKRDRARALAEANAALAKAQTPLVAKEGESPEDFSARIEQQTADIKAATQQRNDALFAIQRAADEKRAAQERKARDDSRELQRRHFEEQLGTLESQLEKGNITAKQFRTRLLNLFEKFGVPFKAAGQALGSALAEGLHDSFADAAKAARALVEAIANEVAKAKIVANVEVHVTKRGVGTRAAGGPVRAGSPYIVGEKGPELFVPKLSGAIVPAGAGVSGGAAMAELHTHVYLDSAQIAEVIRREYLRFEKRNGRTAV